jgi:hypothetical protein
MSLRAHGNCRIRQLFSTAGIEDPQPQRQRVRCMIISGKAQHRRRPAHVLLHQAASPDAGFKSSPPVSKAHALADQRQARAFGGPSSISISRGARARGLAARPTAWNKGETLSVSKWPRRAPRLVVAPKPPGQGPKAACSSSAGPMSVGRACSPGRGSETRPPPRPCSSLRVQSRPCGAAKPGFRARHFPRPSDSGRSGSFRQKPAQRRFLQSGAARGPLQGEFPGARGQLCPPPRRPGQSRPRRRWASLPVPRTSSGGDPPALAPGRTETSPPFGLRTPAPADPGRLRGAQRVECDFTVRRGPRRSPGSQRHRRGRSLRA